MKQHITPEQLEELSKGGKKRIRDWWKPKWNDRCFIKVSMNKVDNSMLNTVLMKEESEYAGWQNHLYQDTGLDQDWKLENYKNKLLPQLSIGQMIEFIFDSERDGRYTKKPQPINFFQERYLDYDGWYIVPEELCDDLWEAVKEILNDK